MLKMNVKQHMKTHGLPLLKYLRHPNDDSKEINMINNQGLFDKKKGKRNGKTATKHYDSYERAHQQDAIMFLTNSITPMLKLKLLQICQDNDFFIAYCFTLIHMVRLISVKQIKETKKMSKGRNIKNYPGEDLFYVFNSCCHCFMVPIILIFLPGAW